jgi:hypothetical protein
LGARLKEVTKESEKSLLLQKNHYFYGGHQKDMAAGLLAMLAQKAGERARKEELERKMLEEVRRAAEAEAKEQAAANDKPNDETSE